MSKPEPVVTAEVCSLCGLDWSRHGEKPKAETCIELLKAELSMRPPYPYLINQPLHPWQNPIITYTATDTTAARFASGGQITSGTVTRIGDSGTEWIISKPDDEEPPESMPVAV